MLKETFFLSTSGRAINAREQERCSVVAHRYHFSLKIAVGGHIELRLQVDEFLDPACQGGGSVHVKVVLVPEHMAVLDQDGEQCMNLI